MRRHFRTAAAALIGAALPLAAQAAAMLDQEHMTTSNFGIGIETDRAIGQSFTVGLDGFLDRVELSLSRIPQQDPAILTVRLRPIIDGEVGDVLRSATRSSTDVPSSSAFVSFDFLDLEVDVGDVFLVQLVTDQDDLAEIFWDFDPGDGEDQPGTYAGGSAFDDEEPITLGIQDMGFRTFVTADAVEVPEPSGLALTGLAALALARRRKRAPTRRAHSQRPR